MPLVSLIMPMRNAAPFVEAALRSILSERQADLEVIVVDDGSTDGSADVVQRLNDPRVRIVPGPCKGISAAMNAGIAEAKGEFVCRCDADDLYPPGRLARQAAWLCEHPEFGAICGSFSTIARRGDPIADLDCGPVAQEVTAELAEGKTRTHLCTWLVRTALVRRAGGFRPWFATAEDLDLQLRLGNLCRVWYEPVVCLHYRLHDGSITHQQLTNQRLFYEHAARLFQHQRRQGRPDDLEQGDPPELPAPEQSQATMAGHHMQDLLIGSAWREHRAGRKMQAVRAGWRACMARPSNPGAWKSLLAIAVRPARPADKRSE
jgi:glycosyltransferase involved in cell wall biosynthesis